MRLVVSDCPSLISKNFVAIANRWRFSNLMLEPIPYFKVYLFPGSWNLKSHIMDKLLLVLSSEQSQYKSLENLLNKDKWRVIFFRALDIKLLTDLTSGANDGRTICLAVLDPTNYQFSLQESKCIRKFCQLGNSLFVAGGSNEDKPISTNFNRILRKFDVRFNRDCVIRPNPFKQYHPREAPLEDFVANRSLGDSIKKYMENFEIENSKSLDSDSARPRILYANGCTINVSKKTSIIMMTSSKWALPNQQAICTFYKDSSNDCRVVVFGSASLMSDNYIHKEDNEALVKALFEFIVHKDFTINISDARTIEIPKSLHTPDINELIDTPISCLQESQHLPKDKASLIDKNLFKIDSSKVPDIARAFQDLNVSNKPLTLIKPNLESSPFEFEPATHGFLLRTSIKLS